MSRISPLCWSQTADFTEKMLELGLCSPELFVCEIIQWTFRGCIDNATTN